MLEILSLEGTELSDAGLRQLMTLKHLHSLNLIDATVTEKAIAELRRALPECGILTNNIRRTSGR